jgi:nicotinamide-nucleotide amidase
MTNAEIIAIGTEMLLGENVDTNTSHIAKTLSENGINLFRTTIIGDNQDRIASAIRESLTRTDILITTGGLGPTVDDPTRAAVAEALGVSLDFHPSLWEVIQERFKLMNRPITENNRLQAYIPAGAIPVHNPVGTAPAFIVDSGDKTIASLPGVPGEMTIILRESILPFLRKKYQIETVIKSRVIHCSGIGESAVDELISDLEKRANPTVGLLAHPGQVDIRITAMAGDEIKAEEIILPLARLIRDRLGENIFGENEDTLSGKVYQNLISKPVALELLASIHPFSLVEIYSADILSILRIKNIEPNIIFNDFEKTFYEESETNPNSSLGIWGGKENSKFNLNMIFHQGSDFITQYRIFAGPPESISLWIRNMSLDFLRRNLG